MKKLVSKLKSKEPQQKERLLEVPMDTIGKLANDYIDLTEEIANRQETIENIGADLCKALRIRPQRNQRPWEGFKGQRNQSQNQDRLREV